MPETSCPEPPNAALGLLVYWYKIRGDRVLPDRSEIDPLKLRRWLGDISVIELHEGEKRFFVKLEGTRVAENIGLRSQSRYIEDYVPTEIQAAALRPYREAMEQRVPIYSLIRPGLFTGAFKKFERLVLPFSGEDPDKVDRFVVWVGPTDRDIYVDGPVYGTRSATPSEQAEAQDCETLVVLDAASLNGHLFEQTK